MVLAGQVPGGDDDVGIHVVPVFMYDSVCVHVFVPPFRRSAAKDLVIKLGWISTSHVTTSFQEILSYQSRLVPRRKDVHTCPKMYEGPWLPRQQQLNDGERL